MLGRAVACISWGVIALLFLSVTAYTVMVGALQLGLVGKPESVRIVVCDEKFDGRGGSHVECVADLVRKESVAGPSRVTVLLQGRPGQVTEAVKAPEGTWIPLRHGPLAWAERVLLSLLPLAAAGFCCWLAVRAARKPGGRRPVYPLLFHSVGTGATGRTAVNPRIS